MVIEITKADADLILTALLEAAISAKRDGREGEGGRYQRLNMALTRTVVRAEIAEEAAK